MKRPWRTRLVVLGLFLAVVGGLVWGFRHSPELLDASEPVTRVDAVLALGGGAEQRPFAAAALWRKGYTTKLLVPQTRDKTAQKEGYYDNEADRYLKIWAALGVPKEATEFLPGAADSTRDEAKLLAQWLQDHPGKTVGIITHTWHTRRTKMLFARILGSEAHRVHFFGIVQDGYCPDSWWLVPDWGKNMAFEWIKLASQAVIGR